MLAWLVQSSEKVRCCVSQINALKDTITVPAFAINPLHLSQRWRRVPQSVGRRYGGNSIKKGALGDFTAAPPVRRIHNTPVSYTHLDVYKRQTTDGSFSTIPLPFT